MECSERRLHRLSLALPCLYVFPQLSRYEAVTAFLDLLASLRDEKTDAAGFYQRFNAFVRVLGGRNWPEYLVEGLLQSRPERHGLTWDELGSSDLLRHDLRVVQEAASVKASCLTALAVQRWPELVGGSRSVFSEYLSIERWPRWQGDPSGEGFCREGAEIPGEASRWLYRRQRGFGAAFWREPDWADNGPLLCEHMSRLGCGVFQKAVALCWDEDRGGLMPVARPDAVEMRGLFRQEREQQIVRENTERFLRGDPACDVIVYGSRGTGKSSLVKALLNAYADKGLRLIQVRKKQLSALPGICRCIAGEPLWFILFIDDLSFEDQEAEYKELKSLLEGGLESRPPNMLIYATSNRRHLMPETFAERRDEVHGQDAVEEKLSLADRFGLTVTFLSPDQESYLAIVRGLAEQAGLLGSSVSEAERASVPELMGGVLEEQALRWAMMHNGRSGRTARQFVESLRRRV